MKLEYETDRLILKIIEPTAEHARQVLAFYDENRDVFEPYEPQRPVNFYTENYQKSLLSCDYNLTVQMKNIRFWVYEKNSFDQPIGTICFHNITRFVYDRCEVGYKFDKRFWHLGYAKEALTKGISVMFDELNLHRIEAFVMERNLPSIRLLENLGFHYEGTCRQSIRIENEWQDHMLFALLK